MSPCDFDNLPVLVSLRLMGGLLSDFRSPPQLVNYFLPFHSQFGGLFFQGVFLKLKLGWQLLTTSLVAGRQTWWSLRFTALGYEFVATHIKKSIVLNPWILCMGDEWLNTVLNNACRVSFFLILIPLEQFYLQSITGICNRMWSIGYIVSNVACVYYSICIYSYLFTSHFKTDNERIFSQHLQNRLLPHHTYSVVSGGDPMCIPELTWEQLKQFHATHDHPSNAR